MLKNQDHKALLLQAKQSIAVLNPAIEAVKALGAVPALNEYNKITNFTDWLETLKASNELVITEAITLYANRPIQLITKAFILALVDINAEINLLDIERKGLMPNYQAKVDELKKHCRLSDREIDQIITDPKDEIERMGLLIKQLEVERDRIQVFVHDCPRYDVTLLAGTRLAV